MNNGQSRPTLHDDDRHLVRVVEVVGDDRLEHWCRIFEVTPTELNDAVVAVGRNPDLVRRHFQVRRLRRA
jgi:uncharacterized protein DUF3606